MSFSSPLMVEKQEKPHCVTCKKSVKNNAVECNWCRKWEHKVCANLSENDYISLGSSSDNVKFYCTHCAPKVGMALEFLLILLTTRKLLIKAPFNRVAAE